VVARLKLLVVVPFNDESHHFLYLRLKAAVYLDTKSRETKIQS